MNDVMSASESSCAPNSLVTRQRRASDPSQESSRTHRSSPHAASTLWPLLATISDSTPIIRLKEVNPLTITNPARTGRVILPGAAYVVCSGSIIASIAGVKEALWLELSGELLGSALFIGPPIR